MAGGLGLGGDSYRSGADSRLRVRRRARIGKQSNRTALSRIHPDASDVLQRAKGELSRYEFTSVSIVGFYDLKIDRTTIPHTASVSIDVIASGKFGGYSWQRWAGIGSQVRREGSRWLVYDFSEKVFPLLQ